jgi:hypothetical protein
MGQFDWVSVFRKIAFALSSLKAATQCNFRGRPPRSHFFASGWTSARQRALNHEASCWSPGIFRHPGRAKQYLFDRVARLRCRQSFAKPGEWPADVSIENFSKQLLLVAKGGVKTWPIDPHGPREMGERSAVVTFGPKNVHGTFQDRVRIEGAGSSKPGSGF